MIFHVGPTGDAFTISVNLLTISPSFKLDYPRWKDKIQAKLGGIDPNDFRNLQTYLYEGDFDEWRDRRDISASWKGLRNVYFLAIDFELEGLK